MQGLQSSDHLQTSLIQKLSTDELKKRERLMETIDKLNWQYGSGTMNWAICGLQQTLNMRREQPSNSSTTNIKEIPIVYS